MKQTDIYTEALICLRSVSYTHLPKEKFVVHRLCVGDWLQRFFVLGCDAQFNLIVAVNQVEPMRSLSIEMQFNVMVFEDQRFPIAFHGGNGIRIPEDFYDLILRYSEFQR